MTQFLSSLQSWQLFFSTVAAASATLTGLLFVSLSLNRERLTGRRAKVVLASARLAFSDFLYVLMIAIVFLVPHQIPISLTVALLVLGLSRALFLIRDYYRNWRTVKLKMNSREMVRELGLPALASTGLVVVALATLFGITDSFYWLVLVIAALLVTACWQAWLLLVEE